MATIGVDIDETLYSFNDAIRTEFFKMAEEYDDKSILKMAYSNNLEWRNLVDHDMKLGFEGIERVHSNQYNYDPFSYAVDTLNQLVAKDHEIIYIGARKEKHLEHTEAWLEKHFPAGEVICADPQKSKIEYLQNTQYLIDDRPRTIFDFLNDGTFIEDSVGPRKVFGLWRPYNQNLTEVKNLYLAPTWYGLNYYLRRKGLL